MAGALGTADTTTPRRAWLALVLAGGLLLGGVPVTPATAASAVYVMGTRTLSVVSTENPSVIARIPIAAQRDPGDALRIATHPNGRIAYVLDPSVRLPVPDPVAFASRVVVVDTASQTVIATVPTPRLVPTGLILHPDGRYLFVAVRLIGLRGTSLIVIDTETNTVSSGPSELFFGGGFGSLRAINPAGTRLYLSGNGASGFHPSIEIIDTTTRPLTLVKSIDFSDPLRRPSVGSLVVHPAGTFVYAATDHGIAVIDAASNTVIGTVTPDAWTSTSLGGLAIDPTGAFVYAFHSAFGDQTGWLSVIDTHTNTVRATVALPMIPTAAAVDVTRNRVYVVGDSRPCPEVSLEPCLGNAAGVAVVDAATWQLITVVPPPPSPTAAGASVSTAVAVDPEGSAVYALDSSGSLSVIDPVALTASATLPGGVAMAVGAGLPPAPGRLQFYVTRSRDGVAAGAQFGAPGDRPVPADYDGDGRADLALFRPRESGGEGVWWIARSSDGGVSRQQWGAALFGDVPVPADYDGDRRADLAVWRPAGDPSGQGGLWYIVRSSDGSTVCRQWGSPDDVPVAADYDGDGRADIAVWRPETGTWFVVNSGDGTTRSVQFGALGDVPVPADYDGDRRADLAVWRPTTGEWFVLSSRTDAVIATAFGAPGDVPLPRDYDGDGQADLTVWRPNTGEWFILSSRSGSVLEHGWGAGGDLPVPRDYDGDGRADLSVYRP